MDSYIRNGRYNASKNDFIYYEVGARVFYATVSYKGDRLEVCYGNASGGADHYDLPLSARNELLAICGYSSWNTRKLMKYVRENDMNKKTEVVNGLGVRMKLTDENSFALLARFKIQARKQGKDKEAVEAVIKEATSGDYYKLIGVLAENIAH